MPAWLKMWLAVATFALLYIATTELELHAHEGVPELTEVLLRAGLFALAKAAQYVLPALLLVSAFVSIVEGRDNPTRQGNLLRPPCPECGSMMMVYKAPFGVHTGTKFLGCVRAPDCAGQRPLREH